VYVIVSLFVLLVFVLFSRARVRVCAHAYVLACAVGGVFMY